MAAPPFTFDVWTAIIFGVLMTGFHFVDKASHLMLKGCIDTTHPPVVCIKVVDLLEILDTIDNHIRATQ
jgi:hypothetical protein